MSRKTNTCPSCGDDSTESKHPSGYCKPCGNKLARKYRIKKDKERPFYNKHIRKKTECRIKGLPYNLSEEYLEQIWTGVCPIFGIKIVLTGSLSDSNYANLDRIDPKLGYIKGNVQWLSARANRLKNNMTIDELKRLYECLVK